MYFKAKPSTTVKKKPSNVIGGLEGYVLRSWTETSLEWAYKHPVGVSFKLLETLPSANW